MKRLFSFNFSESKDNTKYKSLSIDLKSTSSVTERLVVSTTYKTTMESAIFTRKVISERLENLSVK